MRRAPLQAMKVLLAIGSMVLLAACVGTSGGGDGTGGTGPTGAISVPCTDCLSQTVSWSANGGLQTYTESSALSACRTFTYTRTPVSQGSPTSCSVTIGGCDAGAPAVHDVEKALADPDVQAALAGSVPLYGTDPGPCDGAVMDITVGSKTLSVGGDCTGGSCIGAGGPSCVPVPAGVRALADLLSSLKQASVTTGDCAQQFP